jgi:phytoene synthase
MAEKSISPILDAKDTDTVYAAVKNSGSSFLIGMMAVAKERRPAMFGLYAFCRVVDDIADSDWDAQKRMQMLDQWRGYVAELYKGRASHPVMEILQPYVAPYALQEKDFLAIIEGMAMDAVENIQAPSWAQLDHYCDCVASAVGRVSVRIFGETSEAGQKLAHHLGRALQLTNILRDIDEDASRHRLYLPGEALQEAGLSSFALPDVIQHPAIDMAARAVARVAFDHFTQSDIALAQCNPRAIKPARLMRDYYEALLYKQLTVGWAFPRVRVGLSPWEKIGLLLKAVF